VLDPFGGVGTTALVAARLQRDAILVELNPAHAETARARVSADQPMFTTVDMVGALFSEGA
jgi:DNA modification methylase